MFSRDCTNLYFNPGCALNLYRPENAERIFAYLQANFPKVHVHDICCRHNPQLPAGSVIVNICAGCDQRFRSLYDGISTVSLWELLDELGNFPFPDYHGMNVSIHDPCPVRDRPAVHRAVRSLLHKMNITIVEAERAGTASICCGDSLYPACSTEKVYEAMKMRARSMPCEHVVVYFVSCIKAMSVGGRTQLYLVDLLLGQSTAPGTCDVAEWHHALDTYIAAH